MESNIDGSNDHPGSGLVAEYLLPGRLDHDHLPQAPAGRSRWTTVGEVSTAAQHVHAQLAFLISLLVTYPQPTFYRVVFLTGQP